LGTTINLEAPKAELLRFLDLDARLAEERMFAVLRVYVRGDIPGHLVVLFDREDALAFVRMFLRRVTGDLQETVVETTLKELANIVASSYLDALIRLTDANMLPSVPVISYGSMRAALEAFTPAAPKGDVFFVESTFVDCGAKISGTVMFVPDTGAMEPLLAAFGV
jgi:chemotaxis protein CheY-P-specific phosphatase CheC